MALLPPAPASLPTAYLTDERLAMRDAVRSFAMNVVLPVANELDPQHGLIPQHVVSTMAEMGLFGILVPERVRRPRSRARRVLHGDRGARPGVDERGEHHRPWQWA